MSSPGRVSLPDDGTRRGEHMKKEGGGECIERREAFHPTSSVRFYSTFLGDVLLPVLLQTRIILSKGPIISLPSQERK